MKLAIGLLAAAAFAQDPETALQQLRDKVLAAKPASAHLTCVETIDRSYYTRSPEPTVRPACEKLVLDRKQGLSHLSLARTDRLRIAVTISQGHELYSWTGEAPYAHGVEDILNTGPIGTGSFGTFLLDVFTNPAVRFHLLSEPGENLNYGFRVPVEASRYFVAAGQKRVAAEYTGSLRVQAGSLALTRLELDTGELPEDTSMCEESSSLEFRDSNRFLPTESRSHTIMRDTTESERVITLLDCREAPAATAPAPPVAQSDPLPKRVTWTLQLESAIDTDTAAAGDPISALVFNPAQLRIPIGRVTGRIVHMIQQGRDIFVGIAWETFYKDGKASPFYAERVNSMGNASRLPVVTEIQSQPGKLTGHGMANWPFGVLQFTRRGDQPLVIPAGTLSSWRTVAPPQ